MSLKITYLSHSAFLIEGSKKIIIDPFLSNNPRAQLKSDDLPKLDYTLVTHDHDDHIGDAIYLSKKFSAKIVCIFEVAKNCINQEDIHPENVVSMNIGGKYSDENLQITMVQAVHSSFNGVSAGFVVEIDEKIIYHAGDTCYFSDMKLVKKSFGKIDIGLFPIGGLFTMDEKEAAKAVKTIKPKLSIPMHYNTWNSIKADTNKFINYCGRNKTKIMEVGEELIF